MNLTTPCFNYTPCVYLFRNAKGEIIYVGKATTGFQKRILNYRLVKWRLEDLIEAALKTTSQYKKGQLLSAMLQIQLIVHKFDEIEMVDFIYLDSKQELKQKEIDLIHEHMPCYNVKHNSCKDNIAQEYIRLNTQLANIISFDENQYNLELFQKMEQLQQKAIRGSYYG